ncbi:MAG: ABC transporter [Acidimicrobiales bacterium]
MLTTATGLRDRLQAARFDLETEAVEPARVEREAIVTQLDDYVLPRLRDLDAPALAVVGGSTGSGKSTLLNSLIGAEVSKPGVLRPTTSSPVLVHHPDAARWFADDRILPGLARVTGGPSAGPNELGLVASATLPAGLALVDTPDIDSVADRNRALASQLLDAADLWLFVTTAARYADAVPWGFLRRAARRGVGIALVLNRVPPGARDAVVPHLSEMLSAEGLGGAPVFVIDEQPLEDGRIPAHHVQPVLDWLKELASDQAARAELIRGTLLGTVTEIGVRTQAVAAAADHQVAVIGWLRDRAEDRFAAARSQIHDDVRDGTVMRGEVLARWQDLVGTGDLLRQLQSTIGGWRDRLTAAITGRPTSGDRFQGAIESGVETLLRARLGDAAEHTAADWRTHPAGIALLAASDTVLERPSDDLPERAGRMVRDWQGALLELLRSEGSSRRSAARVLSYGVNGVALVLMVAIFAQTGGLTGGEVAVAGGSSALGQKVLEAVLGDQAVRRLAATARADLDERTAVLVDEERSRFTDALAGAHVDITLPDDLRRLAHELRRGVGA